MADLNEIQSKILTPFVNGTVKTLKEMAFVDSSAGDAFEDDINQFRFKGYAVAIQTIGSVKGTILMHFYIETALEIGNKVLAALLGAEEALEEISPEMEEALEEFGNTAVGIALHDLRESEIGIKFYPPLFVTNTEEMDFVKHGATEVISAPITIDGVGRFYFNYLIHS